MSAISATLADYYRQHSLVTELGPHAPLTATLGSDVPRLCVVVRNLLLHNWEAMRDTLPMPPERRREIEIRPLTRLLDRAMQLDARPLTERRSADRLLVVDCRHFATLLCGLLRERGVPARVRAGFAAYLEESHYQSHLVCEYWNAAEQRWILADADVGNPDLVPDQFWSGLHTWQLCRSGAMDAERFGYGPDIRGLWTVAMEAVRDAACVNKFEALSFDNWGLIEAIDQRLNTGQSPLVEADFSVLDAAATHYTANNTAFAQLQALYQQHDALRVPRTIRCRPYTGNPPYSVDLAEDLGQWPA